jgi:hypothetical protein
MPFQKNPKSNGSYRPNFHRNYTANNEQRTLAGNTTQKRTLTTL